MTRPSNWVQKFVQFPVTRIFLGLGVLFAAILLMQSALRLIPGIHQGVLDVLGAVAVALTALFAYVGFVRLVEKRTVTELSTAGAALELGKGALLGGLLFAATIGLIALFGFYHVSGFNPWTVLLPALSLSIVSGVVEEVLVRGILFRIMEESLGTWLALAISALLFGLMHISNPNATLWSALAIAIEAGIMLAAAFVFTRRLWLAIGIHFAWNFVQGGIFGVAVSGNGVQGLLQSTLDGPPLLSGGAFGAEASIFAVIVCLAAGIYLTWSAWKKGNFIQPFWTK
ncbi:MAG: CPBP family intramembrane metalloprotease [Chloroflexi bacterium]|nr:CPBP family intramembrane metalloprotease [Chloroflexota bacterium]